MLATYGGAGNPSIAIDDVYVIPFKCAEYPTTTMAPTTPIIYPILPLNCDFERDYCTWSNDTSAATYWKRNNRLISNSGPFSDHTFLSANGHYLLFEVYLINQFIKPNELFYRKL